MRVSALVASLVWMAAAPAMSAGAVVVSLNNPGSTTLHEVVIEPGRSFAVGLNLDTDCELFWIRAAIQANVSNVFAVEEIVDKSPWSSLAYPSVTGSIDPVTDPFTATLPFPDFFGPGSTGVATVLLTVDSTAPIASYTLQLVDVTFHWTRVNPVGPGVGVSGPSFLVHVVPEPATALLILGGSVGVRRRRRPLH